MTDSVAQMEIGENGNHIAALAFGNTAEIFMYFNTITGPSLTRTSVINRLSNFTQLGGVTRIDIALLRAQTEIFTVANGMRNSDEIRKVGNENMILYTCSLTTVVRQLVYIMKLSGILYKHKFA